MTRITPAADRRGEREDWSDTQVNRGDRIIKPIEWMAEKTGLGNQRKENRLAGTVVYIHPKGRFYTLEFHLPHGSFRESFPMELGGAS